MATIGNSNLTLADLAAQAEPGGGKLSDITEVLRQKQPILDDIPWVPCNDGSTHKSVIRTGLPAPTWRRLYGGIAPTKGTTAPVVDACGMLEDLAENDVDLIDKSADPGKARINESKAHIQGIAHSLASAFFYESQATNPERLTGLSPRFNSLSAQNADNIVSGGGAGSDNTSMWLIDWDETTVHGLIPRGSVAGLTHKDEGMDWVPDASDATKKFKVYRDHFKWDAGFCVRDWRGIVRVPNIDISDLNTIANTKNLITWMIQASERMDPVGKAVWYVNRTIREKLRLGILEKITTNLTWETVSGKRVMVFDGFEVKRCDALLNTETVVS